MEENYYDIFLDYVKTNKIRSRMEIVAYCIGYYQKLTIPMYEAINKIFYEDELMEE